MPQLVHLNGPPGIGKSTLARRYVDDHPLAFCLDLDVFRGLIGRWNDHEQESGRLARRMAIVMAREHLSSGHDVVIPQLVAKAEFVIEMQTLAAELGASFVEIVLLDDRDKAAARFAARAKDDTWAVHHAAASRMIEASGGYHLMYDRVVAAIPELPGALQVRTTAGETDAAYAAVLAAIASQ